MNPILFKSELEKEGQESKISLPCWAVLTSLPVFLSGLWASPLLKNRLEKERYEVLGCCNVREILLSCPSFSMSALYMDDCIAINTLPLLTLVITSGSLTLADKPISLLAHLHHYLSKTIVTSVATGRSNDHYSCRKGLHPFTET